MKRPAYQWYPGDFRRDMGLQSCSWEARALWRDLLDIMHDGQPHGHLAVNNNPLTLESVAKMIGLSLPRVKKYLVEIESAGVSSRTESGILFSRRMVKDEEIRVRRAAGGAKSLDNPRVPKPRGRSSRHRKGHPSDRPPGGPHSSPSPPPSGGPLQSAVASASADITTPSGVAPRGGWPARLAGIFAAHIGDTTPGEMGGVFAESVKLHGEDLVALGLEEWCKVAPTTEKAHFLNPKSAARQIGLYISRLKPVQVYDDRGEPTPEFLRAVGRAP